MHEGIIIYMLHKHLTAHWCIHNHNTPEYTLPITTFDYVNYPQI